MPLPTIGIEMKTEVNNDGDVVFLYIAHATVLSRRRILQSYRNGNYPSAAGRTLFI